MLGMKGAVRVSSTVWVGRGGGGGGRGEVAEPDSRTRGTMKRGVHRLCLLLVWQR